MNRIVIIFFVLIMLFSSGTSCFQYAEAGVMSYHPRIWITSKDIRDIPRYSTEKIDKFLNGYHGAANLRNNYIDNGGIPGADAIIPLALAYHLTGEESYADAAVAAVMQFLKGDSSPRGSFTKMAALGENMISVAVGFDWLYDKFDKTRKEFIIREVNKYMDILMPDYLQAPWHEHAQRTMAAIGIWGHASYGDNARAQEFIDHARQKRFDKLLDGFNNLFGKGGALPAGSFYGLAYHILGYTEAVYTSTGEDLYMTSPWFSDRIRYWLLFDYPGIFYDSNPIGYSNVYYDGTYGNQSGQPYSGYLIYEDGHRGRSRFVDAVRVEKTMLIHHFSDESSARQLQYTMNIAPLDSMRNPETYKTWPEVIWFNPLQKVEKPSLLSHPASGAGLVLMRSDWTDSATWISFKCADIFSTSHQHWDQNSFTIFKKGDLAIKSGLYDGDGTSDHNVNYFSRTISANSILVYNPDEVFVSWRGVHYPALANDGGQKAYRDKNEFQDAEDWKKSSDLNDSGKIIFYEEALNYTYVQGDATNAYNNSRYSTPKMLWKKVFGKNDPKVGAFTREFVFLRPDYIVVFDRVVATKEKYAKKWLLHFLNRPSIKGYSSSVEGDKVNGGTIYTDADETISEAGGGKLFVKTLLPEDRQIRLVGGRGFQDYWVFGRNVSPDRRLSNWQKDYGEWRIEIEPQRAKKEDLFLNVLYPCDANVKDCPDSILVKSKDDKMAGAYIKGNDGLSSWVIMFSKNVKGDTGIAEYKINGDGMVKQLICSMKPKKIYVIMQNGSAISSRETSENGLLYFETTLSGDSEFAIREKV